MTNREAYEQAAGIGLDDAFFSFNGIDPNAYYQCEVIGCKRVAHQMVGCVLMCRKCAKG
jgi:hypothetical protein